jgi:hypothetical protein
MAPSLCGRYGRYYYAFKEQFLVCWLEQTTKCYHIAGRREVRVVISGRQSDVEKKMSSRHFDDAMKRRLHFARRLSAVCPALQRLRSQKIFRAAARENAATHAANRWQ